MKKALTLNRTFSLLAAVLILTLSACKKDTSNGSINIVGKWSNHASGNTDLVGQYEFKSNDSVKFYAFKIDTVTKNIIGYSYESTGKYKIEKSVLTMYNLTNFSNPGSNFVPLAELVKGGGATTTTYTIALNSQKNQLFFYFTCPINADCIPSPLIYYKE